MIAQAPSQHHAVRAGQSIWCKIASLEMPTQVEYADYMSSMHLAAAMIIFICGMVYLLQGWKAFKMLVIINAALLGGFVGNNLGGMLQGQNMPLFCAAAGALMCAVLAWPLMKFAVGLMAGLAGAFLGSGIWSYVTTSLGQQAISQHAWAGALMGLITLGLLSFVIFRLVIMIFTSLQGAVMTLTGLVSMLMHIEPLRNDLYHAVSNNTHLLVLLIGTPAVMGFAYQYSCVAKKMAKRKKKEEDG